MKSNFTLNSVKKCSILTNIFKIPCRDGKAEFFTVNENFHRAVFWGFGLGSTRTRARARLDKYVYGFVLFGGSYRSGG